MTSSPTMPADELGPTTADASLAQTPLAELGHQAHRTGLLLVGAAAIGGFLGIVVASPLGFLMALVCAAAGAYLIRACHPVVPSAERSRVWLERRHEAVEHLSALGHQLSTAAEVAFGTLAHVTTRMADIFASLLRAACRLIAAMVAGLSAGLIVLGLFALWRPEPWEFDVLTRIGPPVAPLALAIGFGLIVTQILAFILLRQRR